MIRSVLRMLCTTTCVLLPTYAQANMNGVKFDGLNEAFFVFIIFCLFNLLLAGGNYFWQKKALAWFNILGLLPLLAGIFIAFCLSALALTALLAIFIIEVYLINHAFERK